MLESKLDRRKWNEKNVYFSINKYGYEVAKNLAINKRVEMELSLNHYSIALPPLEPQ